MSKLTDRVLVLCGFLRLELIISLLLFAAYVAVNAGTSFAIGQAFTYESFQRASFAVVSGLWKPAIAVVGMTTVWCIFGPFEMNHAEAKRFFLRPLHRILTDLRKPIGKRKQNLDNDDSQL